MVRRAPAAGVLAALALAAVLAGHGAGNRASAGDTPVGTGVGGVERVMVGPPGNFDFPVEVASAPGVGDLIYVVEQAGEIEAVDPVTGNKGAQPFLDITERVSFGGEEGLLSIAFDPDYQTNALFYVFYVNKDGNIEIDEFAANSDNDASEGSRRRVLTIKHDFASNHNGGEVRFGRGGLLYASTGDGGIAGDPRENAQKRSSLLGKLLRIDPHGDGPGDYSVPRTNPFVGRRGRDEILARGLRNPFRFSFDGRRILIGDVGQNAREEVDYERPRGLRNANFGWDRFEGRIRFDMPGDNEAKTPRRRNHDRPIHDYGRAQGGTIIGGYVVRDPNLDTLFGRYVYIDFQRGQLRSLIPQLGGAEDDKAVGGGLPDFAGPSSFGLGPGKEVYLTELQSGNLYRLEPGM